MAKEQKTTDKQDVIFISKSRRHSIGNYKPEELYPNGKLKCGEKMIEFEDWGYTVASKDPEYEGKILFLRNGDGFGTDFRIGTQDDLNKVRLARLPGVREMATAGKDKEDIPGMATIDTVALTPEEAMKDND